VKIVQAILLAMECCGCVGFQSSAGYWSGWGLPYRSAGSDRLHGPCICLGVWQCCLVAVAALLYSMAFVSCGGVVDVLGSSAGSCSGSCSIDCASMHAVHQAWFVLHCRPDVLGIELFVACICMSSSMH
jgi:hypothetical protein